VIITKTGIYISNKKRIDVLFIWNTTVQLPNPRGKLLASKGIRGGRGLVLNFNEGRMCGVGV
jgi:hypothetical protein